MSEHDVVTAAQATIAALTESLHAAEARAAKAEGDAANLRAILTHLRTSLNETVNDPATDGGVRA